MINGFIMKHILKFILPAFGVLLLSGCAKEAKTQANYANKLYFDAWIHVNHPQAVESGNGIYILNDVPGTGAAWNETRDGFAYIDFTVTDLDGQVTNTTHERIAQKVGTYAKGNYYGPKIQIVSDDSCPVGLADALVGMRIGGTRTVAIPSWLQTTTRYSKKEEYLDHSTGNNDAIYTITLRKAIPDGMTGGIANIYRWETDSLEAYVKKNFGPDVDSTAYTTDEGSLKYGFYFQSLTPDPDSTVLNSGSAYSLNYTGRLLNGQVFDTTIADTAKVHGIYDPTRTYEPVQINWADKATDITMGESETAVKDGFKIAVFKMHLNEKARTAFYSVLGYGYSGTGDQIPGFSPLVFELELMKEAD